MLKPARKLCICLAVALLFTITSPPFVKASQIGFTPSQWITSFYLAYWNRIPDVAGHAYWLNMYTTEQLTIPEIAENFALQAEAKAAYKYFEAPHAATQEEIRTFIITVYRNLFNREVSPTSLGVTYWVSELQTQAMTPGAAIGNIINAAMQGNEVDWLTVYKRVYLSEDMMRQPNKSNSLCLKNQSSWNINADESRYGDKLSINGELFTKQIMIGDEWCLTNLESGPKAVEIIVQTKSMNELITEPVVLYRFEYTANVVNDMTILVVFR